MKTTSIKFMPKTNVTAVLCMVFVALFSYSCGNNEFEEVNEVEKKLDRKDILLAEAQGMLDVSLSRSSLTKETNNYFCVDFVPCWESARYSEDGIVETVDVGISKDIYFLARNRNGFYVEAPQMLTIVADHGTNNIATYLVTFIPDYQGFNPSYFYTSGSKGEYSGLVIYTAVNNSTILMINKYKFGSKISSINIFTTDIEEIKRRQLIMQEQYLKGIHMYQHIKEN